MKVLILEDNLSFAQSIQQMLTVEGWEVHLASSWKQASSLMDSRFFNALVLDILLPDKKGFDILEILSQRTLNPDFKIALISGLVDEASVQKNTAPSLQPHCRFFKKPFEKKDLLNFLNDQDSSTDRTENFFPAFFLEPAPPSKPINFYLPESKTFDSKELVSAVYLAYLKKLTGHFQIKNNSEEYVIQFHKGCITHITPVKNEAFLGALLVEHGLSLSEDISALLEDKSSSKRIGERLVEKELLSPHMLNIVLKEQIKIRLSAIMSACFSFHLEIKETSPESSKTPDVDLNEDDLLEWLADSIQTELNSDFLSRFYLSAKAHPIQKSGKINKSLIGQKQFLQSYNLFFQSLNDEESIAEAVKHSSDKNQTLKLLYFGLLSRSIYLKSQKKESMNLQKTERFLDSIIQNESSDLFGILNLPWDASVKEVEKNYHALSQKIHPDLLPPTAGEELRAKSEEALIKITNIYEILKTPEKREKYINSQIEEKFMAIMKKYEEGKEQIRKENYREGFNIFQGIVNHKQAPGNTVLYLLWSKIKAEKRDLSRERDEAIKIKKMIDACPINLRTTFLFWFVKGLFYTQVKQYETAVEFFNKSISTQKDFMEAKKELIFVKKLVKNNKPKQTKNFFGLLKKSG